MIPTGSTSDEGRGFTVETRKAGRLCDACGTYIHVGQPAKVGGMRVVHEGCTHPAERSPQWVAFPGKVPVCRDCGSDWHPVRRGECSRCGSDAGPSGGAA